MYKLSSALWYQDRVHVDIAEIEQHRPALTGHCYRMLGSSADAEDAVQETIVRAWRSLERFEGRSSLRTWLYRIATNICLDTLSSSALLRMRPMESGTSGEIDQPLETRERTHWLEPIPDARAIPADADPFQAAVLRQSIRLAFVAALQHLPPRQRAAVILTEVLGWSAAEVAECIGTSVPAVNSALQRARATLKRPADGDAASVAPAEHAALLADFVAAWETADAPRLTALLREDAIFSMPPLAAWFQGREAIQTFLREQVFRPGLAGRQFRLTATRANGSPAFASYQRGADSVYWPGALIVLTLAGQQIAQIDDFLAVDDRLFERFQMPLRLD